MLELLQLFLMSKQQNKIMLNLDYFKINRNYKKFTKITNSMLFTKKLKNMSVKPRRQQTSMLQFCNKRKNRQVK